MDTLFLNEYRCECGKLLLKGIFFDARLEIKCKKCGKINNIGQIKSESDSLRYLLIINEKGIITNANSSAYKILGYDPGELIGIHFTSINPTLPPGIGDKFFGLNSVLNEENYFHLNTSHITKMKRIIFIDAYLKLYKNNKNRYVLLSAEIKKDKIKDKDDYIKPAEFLDNCCDFYFDVDKSGNITYVSESVEKYFGYSPEVGMFRSCFDFVPENIRQRVKKTFNYFSGKALPYKETGNLCSDKEGNIVPLELYFSPNLNELGKFLGYRVLGWIRKI